MTCLDCRPGRPCAECAARGNAAPAASNPTGAAVVNGAVFCYSDSGSRYSVQHRGRLANGAWIGETLVADIIASLSVRAGEPLTAQVIEERSRNIAAALLGKYEIKERT